MRKDALPDLYHAESKLLQNAVFRIVLLLQNANELERLDVGGVS